MRTFIPAIVLLFFSGCRKAGDDCTPEWKKFSFQQNKALDTIGNNVTVINGNDLVFKFYHRYEQCAGVVGGASGRTLYFTVPGGAANSFHYNDSATLTQGFSMVVTDAPVNPQLMISRIKEGYIQGSKMGADGWHIKASVKLGNETLGLDAHFAREN